MRRGFFEAMALLLALASLAFFALAVGDVARRDYVGGALVAAIGFVVLHAGAEMARLALADRS